VINGFRVLVGLGLLLLLVFWSDLASSASAQPTRSDSGVQLRSVSWSPASSAVTGSRSRSASASTRWSAGGVSAASAPQSVLTATEDPPPTPEELRTRINDLLPVVLLGVSVIAATSIMTLLVLIGKR
jgi:hypothetical protein